jgi:hypothetical protein
MKRLLATAMCGGMLLLGATVYAGDPPKDAKHNQMMKECMAKQDPSMSKDGATKACEEKMKAMHQAKKDDMRKDAAPK